MMPQFDYCPTLNCLSSEAKQAFEEHAIACYPEECCGLLVGGKYYPCRNLSSSPTTSFRISGQSIVNAGEKLEAICHSHPHSKEAELSSLDKQRSSAFTVPWIVLAIKIDDFKPKINNC